MKTALFFVFLFVLLLAALSWRGYLAFTPNSVDVRVEDTYVMLERSTFAVLVLLLSATCFSLGGLLGTGFRSRMFWIAFLLVALAWSGVAAFLYWG
ncbi:MAG: hypothetical protein EOO12_06710 [Chitinophagaceae bacterium]|nr:MAG: hypothetical protein EOO12_06710 [Chitinophagaceae bacterium]